MMDTEEKAKKPETKRVEKANKKQIKHDPQAESARAVFGKEKKV